MPQPVHFQATVEQVTRHTADVASYRLRAAKRLPRFAPGQFIHLTIDPYDPGGFWPESRVFSVANAVADRQTLVMTISRQGAYTSSILDHLQPGSLVWGKGPYGEFTIDGRHGYQRTVLIAGGTGITPFCAFMEAALNQGTLPVAEVQLHYGARTPELLIYRELTNRCAVALPGFQVHYYAEQPGLQSDQSVQAGLIRLDQIMGAGPEALQTAYYLSGPKAMIDALRDQMMTAHGLSSNQIYIDAWE